MQEESVVLRKDEDGVRLLSSRRVLSHNRHIKNGFRTRKGCSGCARGLGATDPIPQVEEPRPNVDENSGADAGGDSAPPPASGWPWEKKG